MPLKVGVFRLGRWRRGLLPSERAVRRAVRLALPGRGGEVNVVFCGDEKITELNRDFLSKNRVTDVIAFAYGDAPGLPCGDIYVCAEQGERQSAAYGNTPRAENLTLCVHGALHLAGMDDATPAQRRAMDSAALRVLSRAGAQRGR